MSTLEFILVTDVVHLHGGRGLDLRRQLRHRGPKLVEQIEVFHACLPCSPFCVHCR